MIIVQNDSGTVGNANSYASIAYADSYHSDRGNTSWAAATEDNKTVALIKSWQYIDTAFVFLGYEKSDVQNTEFPRYGILNSRGKELKNIEPQIKNAQSEYALIALTKDFTEDQTVTSTPIVKKTSEKVDVISQEIEYDTSRGIPIIHNFPKADFWLRDFLKGCVFEGYY